MSEDFVTRLQLQLREAALREERRTPVARRLLHFRRGLPGPAPVAAALAAAMLALAIAIGAAALRGEPEPAAPRVIGTYHVASGLASLAPGFGAAWTTEPNANEVLRIDPATRRVAARIPVGGEARVAAGAGAVWALAGEFQLTDAGPVRLLRIDPATDRVVARIPVRTPTGDRFGPVGVQIDGDRVWVLGIAGALRIDPARNVADLFVDLVDESGDDARGAVADGESVWALTVDGRLRQLEAGSRRAVREVQLRATPDSFLSGGPPGTLTLISTGTFSLLERSSGQALWETTLTGDIRDWTMDGGFMWVAHVARPPAERDRVTRLDAESGRRLGHVELPEPGVAGIAKVGREVWVATPGGAIVVVR